MLFCTNCQICVLECAVIGIMQLTIIALLGNLACNPLVQMLFQKTDMACRGFKMQSLKQMFILMVSPYFKRGRARQGSIIRGSITADSGKRNAGTDTQWTNNSTRTRREQKTGENNQVNLKLENVFI